MELSPYLSFDGRCDEAFAFYVGVFGGSVVMRQTYGGSQMATHFPPDFAGKIMHARVKVAGHVLMGSDAPPGRYEAPRGLRLSAGVADEAEAKRLFDALSVGATIEMPLQRTFWSAAFGMLADRFGIGWMVNCEVPG